MRHTDCVSPRRSTNITSFAFCAMKKKRYVAKADDDNTQTKSSVVSISAQLKKLQLQIQVNDIMVARVAFKHSSAGQQATHNIRWQPGWVHLAYGGNPLQGIYMPNGHEFELHIALCSPIQGLSPSFRRSILCDRGSFVWSRPPNSNVRVCFFLVHRMPAMSEYALTSCPKEGVRSRTHSPSLMAGCHCSSNRHRHSLRRRLQR